MRTAGVTGRNAWRWNGRASGPALVALGLLGAAFLLSPVGSDLMFRLGAASAQAVFAWADADQADRAGPPESASAGPPLLAVGIRSVGVP
jgi:hypothetical protein